MRKITSLKTIKRNSTQRIADLPGCKLETTYSGEQYIRGTAGNMIRLNKKPLSKKSKRRLANAE
jgi:hypothetical protein